MSDSKLSTDRSLEELLEGARKQRGPDLSETVQEFSERQAALDSLGSDCRMEERSKRLRWCMAAAALLLVSFGIHLAVRTQDSHQATHEALAWGVDLPSFPRDPFALGFEVASRPLDSLGSLRSGPRFGPRVVAPLGSIVDRRPEILFECEGLPKGGESSLAVSLRDSLGQEVEVKVTDCDEVCRAIPSQDLHDGEWLLVVQLGQNNVDWVDRARFVVRPAADVEELLGQLKSTGDSDLDHLVAASGLINAGFAELAWAELESVNLDQGLGRARTVLLRARAARILRLDKQLEELHDEWLALRSMRDG